MKLEDLQSCVERLVERVDEMEARIESLERQVSNLDSRTTGSVQIGVSAKKWKPENQNL